MILSTRYRHTYRHQRRNYMSIQPQSMLFLFLSCINQAQASESTTMKRIMDYLHISRSDLASPQYELAQAKTEKRTTLELRFTTADHKKICWVASSTILNPQFKHSFASYSLGKKEDGTFTDTYSGDARPLELLEQQYKELPGKEETEDSPLGGATFTKKTGTFE